MKSIFWGFDLVLWSLMDRKYASFIRWLSPPESVLLL
jgi:hypothetical protein